MSFNKEDLLIKYVEFDGFKEMLEKIDEIERSLTDISSEGDISEIKKEIDRLSKFIKDEVKMTPIKVVRGRDLVS